ncbi:MAG: hypothetical protein U0V48_06830 [Anaerolineales bacterium]
MKPCAAGRGLTARHARPHDHTDGQATHPSMGQPAPARHVSKIQRQRGVEYFFQQGMIRAEIAPRAETDCRS